MLLKTKIHHHQIFPKLPGLVSMPIEIYQLACLCIHFV